MWKDRVERNMSFGSQIPYDKNKVSFFHKQIKKTGIATVQLLVGLQNRKRY